jgi:hypothetical protein
MFGKPTGTKEEQLNNVHVNFGQISFASLMTTEKFTHTNLID